MPLEGIALVGVIVVALGALQSASHGFAFRVRRLAQHPRLVRAADLLPPALALVLVSGLIASTASLIYSAHPDTGWSDHLILDAKAAARGHYMYGDPARGYVGLLYTPLYSGVVSILMRVHWWEGWGPLLSAVAVGGTCIALLRMQAMKRLPLASRAFLVVFPLSGFTLFSVNGVFEARADQLAWSLFLIGACRCIADMHVDSERGGRGRVVTGLVLGAAVLTKQTTLAPCLAAAGLVGLSTMQRRGGRTRRELARSVPLEGIALVGVIVVALGALQSASHGFAFDLLFGLPQRHARPWFTLLAAAEVSARQLAVPMTLAAFLVAVTATRVLLGPDETWRRRADALRPVIASVIVAMATVPGLLVALAKQGGDANQLLGPVWGMTLVVFAAFVVTDAAGAKFMSQIAVAVLLIVSVGPADKALRDADLAAPSLMLSHQWYEAPADIIAANQAGVAVWDWAYPSYSVLEDGSSPPAVAVTPDLVAAGYTPRWFLENIADARYGLVRLYDPSWEQYSSGFGQRDEGFLWKFNYLVQAGYDPAPVTRAGVQYYHPSDRLGGARWILDCFGPFRAGPLHIQVRGGGGLWCASATGLELRDGPAPRSELVLRTEQRVELRLDADSGARIVVRSPAQSTVQAAAAEASCEVATTASLRSLHIVLDPAASGLACDRATGEVRVGRGTSREVTASIVAPTSARPLLSVATASGQPQPAIAVDDPSPHELARG